ncbi:hypothetical protein SRHO_G00196000 [Serrasalmus rhombeus]
MRLMSLASGDCVFKLYCLLDTDNISTDSIEYLFLYEQCHEMVIRGQLPACEDDLLSLAALRLQAVQGDYSALAPFPALEQSSTGSFSQRLWLGVAASCVSLYRQGEAEALECLPIAQICSYGVSDSNTFRITAGDRDLLFETSKLTEIMQLMNAYFSATRRQLGKDDCITMETTPKLRPSLLELPSHPV